MGKSLEFNFGPRKRGSAAVISNNSTAPMQTLRELAQEEFGNDKQVYINEIGEVEEREYSYLERYRIYEAYQDSGSDDYWYYAINVGSREA